MQIDTVLTENKRAEGYERKEGGGESRKEDFPWLVVGGGEGRKADGAAGPRAGGKE